MIEDDIYLKLAGISLVLIVLGFISFSFLGLKRIYKSNKSQKIIVTTWIILTIPLLAVESLQVVGAISGFFLFLYVVWLGVVKPTLKK